ncbi:MAG: DUF4214 domain-containing protein [Acidimicrobiales bacterium]
MLCAVTLTVTPAGAQTDTTAPDTTAADTTSPEAPAAPVGDEPVDPADDPGVRPQCRTARRRRLWALPDQAGFDYWVDVYVAGTPLTSVAAVHGLSRVDLDLRRSRQRRLRARHLLERALGREPDEAGYAYWLGLVDGGLSRTKLLLGFSESPEYVTADHRSASGATSGVRAAAGQFRQWSPHRLFQHAQRAWWVESDGRVSNSYLVSGRDNVPDPATYSIYSKSPIAYAGHNGITMKHMVRFTYSNGTATGSHRLPFDPATPMAPRCRPWSSSARTSRRDACASDPTRPKPSTSGRSAATPSWCCPEDVGRSRM